MDGLSWELPRRRPSLELVDQLGGVLDMEFAGIGDVEVGQHRHDVEILAFADGKDRPLLGVGRRDAFAVADDAGDAVRGGNAVAGLDRRRRLALDSNGLAGRGNLGVNALIEAGIKLSQLGLNFAGVGAGDLDFERGAKGLGREFDAFDGNLARNRTAESDCHETRSFCMLDDSYSSAIVRDVINKTRESERAVKIIGSCPVGWFGVSRVCSGYYDRPIALDETIAQLECSGAQVALHDQPCVYRNAFTPTNRS